MSLIDWSDPDEMLGLLVEFVRDEALAPDDDEERAEFLDHLAGELAAIGRRRLDAVEPMAATLRELHQSLPREFMHDEVVTHLADCIVSNGSRRRGSSADVPPVRLRLA
jgi:hypothetical protein